MKAVPVKTLNELVESGVVQLTRGKVISKRDIAACPGNFPIYSSAKDKDGNAVDSGSLVDPRSYMDPVMAMDPAILRENYRTLKDEAFIEVMELVKERIAEHVKSLCVMFGCSGLASHVNTKQ